MRIRTIMAMVTVATTLGCSSESLEIDLQPTRSGRDRATGLSSWSRAAMDAYLRWKVWTGARSGYVALFAHEGYPVYATAAGYADIEARIPMRLETRMRFASMTKPVTAVAALILIEAGKIGLDDPVDRYIPAISGARVATSQMRGADGSFPTEPANPIPTVRHLLTFRSGIGPGLETRSSSELIDHWNANGLRSTETGSLAERVDRVVQLPLFDHPGKHWRYDNSADVLARVVEIAAGEPFGAFLERRIFAPLGMSSTSFLPPRFERGDLARVYKHDETGKLIPTEPGIDANGWTPGGSGLVSTALDYMRFALMLWNGGDFNGTRILSRDTVAEMTRLQISSGILASQGIDGVGWGFGLSVVADAKRTPFVDRNGDFGWFGYYGTLFFVSPDTGLVGVVLSQHEPGPYGRLPLALFVAQALAFAGI